MSHSMIGLVVAALAGLLACAAAAEPGRDEGPAGRYADEALAGQITAKMPAITQTAETIAERIVAGHAVWLGGSYEGFIVEGYYRAGGMMKAGWLKKPEDLQAGDVLLLGTVEGANPQDAILTRAARARGAMVVRIGPGEGEGVDVDLGVPAEGVRRPGRPPHAEVSRYHAPLASVGDTMMLWTLTGEIVGALTRRGKMTPMFESVLVPGGKERNAEHLKLQWEPTCPPAQKAGRLGRTYLAHVTHYLSDLRETQLPKFAEAGRMVRQAIKTGKKAYVIPFGHLPPYEVALAADPGVFAKLPANTDGKALAQVVHAGDVVLYVGYYELPEDIATAAHAAGAKVISFVSGTPEKPAEAMGADVSIKACWPFGDAAVSVEGYDVRILPPSGVMAGVGYWMVVAESLPPRPPSLEGRGENGTSPPGPLSTRGEGGNGIGAPPPAPPPAGEGGTANGGIVSGQAVPLWPGGAPGAGEVNPAQVPTITPFLLNPKEKRAAVIVCPGGGYAGRAGYEGAPISQWLNTIGVVSFVCDYRVTPYKHPRPLQDAQRAIRWVRAHAEECGVDPTKVGILGFSAGGHLAATAGTHYDKGDPQAADPVDRLGCRPDALVLCYPVISFGEYGHHGSMVNLIGENPPEELRHSLSNETQVTPETPPTFLWHTSDDGGVPVMNSLLFAEALSHCKVPFDLHVFSHGPHGMALAEKDAHVGQWKKVCETWLRGLGW